MRLPCSLRTVKMMVPMSWPIRHSVMRVRRMLCDCWFLVSTDLLQSERHRWGRGRRGGKGWRGSKAVGHAVAVMVVLFSSALVVNLFLYKNW